MLSSLPENQGVRTLEILRLGVRPFCLDRRRKTIAAFRDQLGIRQSLASEARDRRHEPLTIRQAAGIEAVGLFVQIAEKVFRVHRNVGALQRALEQRPKVFQPIRVNAVADVLHRMIDKLMDVVRAKRPVSDPSVRVQRATRFHVGVNLLLERFLGRVLYDLGSDARLALFLAVFKQTHDNRFIRVTASDAFLFLFALVHEIGVAADKRFVGFHRPGHFDDGAVLHGEPDAMKHEPRALLRDAQSPVNLARGNAVLGVYDQPEAAHPLAKRQGRVLKNRTHPHTKFLRTALALPKPPSQFVRFGRFADRTNSNPICPSHRLDELEGVVFVGEIHDRLLQSRGQITVHAFNLAKTFVQSSI